MKELYDTVETTLMWGAVVVILGVIIYLAYRQYRTMKYRRVHRRRRARRAMKRAGESMGEHRPSHHHTS
ncbi:MAG: hypothetical protein ABSD29_10060 [Verrucomicrobiota bacterium]